MPTSLEPRRRLLLVIADAEARQRLSRGLREYGYGAHGAADLAAAHAVLAAEPIDLILVEATPTLDEVRPLLAAGPTVLLLGKGPDRHKIEEARAALAAGAYDYLPEPCSAAEVALALEKAAAREARRGDPAASRFLPSSATEAPEPEPAGLPHLIAEAPRMRALLKQVRKLATHRTSVLITGESGSGKELLARMLHVLSPRRARPLVAVNCGAMPETLLESLLFGHRRGAFTDAVRDQVGLFAEADQGTLFLDEIGELSPKLQVKLLRVLQDQRVQPLGAGIEEATTVDVRVVAATLRDLQAEVDAGRFRPDLYYRLSVVPLHVPPLRERVEDIMPLGRHFLKRAAERLGRPLSGFTPAAEQRLRRYRWPGNVRELENTIERTAVLCDHTVLDAADLLMPSLATNQAADSVGTQGALSDISTPTGDSDLSLKTATQRLEAAFIERALLRTRGNRTAAARLLGISHRALLYKLRDYGLDARQRDD